MELEGRRSTYGAERDEVKTEEYSPEVKAGQRLTKAEPEGRGRAVGMMGHGGDVHVMVELLG